MFKAFIDSNSTSLLLAQNTFEEFLSNSKEDPILPKMEHVLTLQEIVAILGSNSKTLFKVNSNSKPRSREPSLFSIQQTSRIRGQNICLDDYILSVDLKDFDLCLATYISNMEDNKISFQQALDHPRWIQAMQEELKSIKK